MDEHLEAIIKKIALAKGMAETMGVERATQLENIIGAERQPLRQLSQSQVGGINNRYAQFASDEPSVAIRTTGDKQVVPVAPIQAKAGRGLVVVAGITLQSADAELEKRTQRILGDASVTQAGSRMG